MNYIKKKGMIALELIILLTILFSILFVEIEVSLKGLDKIKEISVKTSQVKFLINLKNCLDTNAYLCRVIVDPSFSSKVECNGKILIGNKTYNNIPCEKIVKRGPLIEVYLTHTN